MAGGGRGVNVEGIESVGEAGSTVSVDDADSTVAGAGAHEASRRIRKMIGCFSFMSG